MSSKMGIQLFISLYFFGLVSGHELCFPRYGCYNDEAPFNEALTQLPQTPEEIGATFTLHKRDGPMGGELLNAINISSIRNSHFDSKQQTIVITHGYIENSQIFWVKPMVEALLKREDANVIVTDWGKGSKFPYHQAYGNCRLLGAIMAELLLTLQNETGMQLSKAHLIGFSMGAQISGYVGRNLRRMGKYLGRITALDPAGPLYEYKDTRVRLDPSDADFVDVIHTDANTILIKGFGLEQITGHLDFYPNGGKFQPNCRDIMKGPAMFVTCSHWRATNYFTESINSNCPFIGYPCPSIDDFKAGHCVCSKGEICPVMGYDSVRFKGLTDGRTRYYFTTPGKKPFCVYHYRIVLYTGKGIFNDLDGTVYITVTDAKGQSELLEIEDRELNSGSTEYFLSSTRKDLGHLQTVKVTHNALFDIWYLQKLEIRPLWKDVKYTGCYKRWLNSAQNTVQLKTGRVYC